MVIINTIDLQLREILKLLKEDLKESVVIYQYLICENESKFLDLVSMKAYLTETRIENKALLKTICDNCIKIVELWNVDLEPLPEKMLETSFFYSDESKGRLFSSQWDFHAIYLRADKFEFFNTSYGKETFVKDYKYETVAVPLIASKCLNIFNFIKQSYPEINSDFTPEYYFSHYKKTKRFTLQTVVRPYSNNEFNEFEINLENYLIRYKFIADKLIGSDKIEFKHDTVDHLKSIVNKQIHSKYSELLTHAIGQIENNFEVNNIQHTIISNNTNQSAEFIQLLAIKAELKASIKRANTSINAQKVIISKQEQRAVDGQPNTLKFEQEQLPKLESEKLNFEKKLATVKDRIKLFNIQQVVVQPQQIEMKLDEKYKMQNLFKVGLLFANGEMSKYYTVNSNNKTVMDSQFSAPKIAKALGNDGYNKYILASINNYTTDKENGNKNIFNSREMMDKIILHCKTENIPIDAYFESRLPIE